jgi:hypothetical protein
MISGYRFTAVLHVAATLGVADLVHGAARSLEELAQETGVHAPSLLRLLRGLAVMGVMDEVEPGHFRLTTIGELLRTNAPQSLRGMAMRTGDEAGMRTWGNLLHTIKTGETTFDHVHGMSGFEFFAQNPEISAGFNRAMVEGTQAAAPAILDAYDFSRFGTVADIGGGSGALIAAILVEHPGLRGVLFDTPAGADWAPRLLEKAGLANRCEIAKGDFFKDPLPSGCDAYVLKSIIHDWNDDCALVILRRCREAACDKGVLVVIEPVMPEKVSAKDPDRFIVLSDLNMLVNTGGRERTEAEFGQLLATARFKVNQILPTTAPYPLNVIEALPN